MGKLLNFDKFFESAEPGDLEVINYELPDEVRKTTIKILRDNYDRVKSPEFHSNQGEHIVEFEITPLDFKYIDEDQELTLDLTPGVRKKREYDVTLEFDSKSTETNTVVYKIKFDEISDDDISDEFDEDKDEEDLMDDDEYYKPEPDDNFDIEDMDKDLTPSELKKKSFFDIDDFDEDEDNL